jgi:hypothetical protein
MIASPEDRRDVHEAWKLGQKEAQDKLVEEIRRAAERRSGGRPGMRPGDRRDGRMGPGTRG